MSDDDSNVTVSDSEQGQGYVSSDNGGDSDRELQIAFEKGLLKPGLNYAAGPPKKKVHVNNTAGLIEARNKLKNDLDWSERLDLLTKRQKPTTSGDTALVDDDFTRETSFYMQAQAAVLEAIPRLKKLGIPVARPEDYYAQMAKSDKHMEKVRSHLLTVQKNKERATAVRQLREQRKFAANVQNRVLENRQSDKKKLAQAVKKHRKGMKEQLEEMLGESEAKLAEHREQRQKQGNKQQQKKGLTKKRQFRNEKFGFGGRKKGGKRNTAETAGDMSMYSSRTGIRLNRKGRPQKGAPKLLGPKKGGIKKKRLEKSRRK